MKTAIEKILATVVAAGVIANVSVLWNMNSRLTRIETKLETMHAAAPATSSPQLAKQ